MTFILTDFIILEFYLSINSCTNAPCCWQSKRILIFWIKYMLLFIFIIIPSLLHPYQTYGFWRLGYFLSFLNFKKKLLINTHFLNMAICVEAHLLELNSSVISTFKCWRFVNEILQNSILIVYKHSVGIWMIPTHIILPNYHIGNIIWLCSMSWFHWTQIYSQAFKRTALSWYIWILFKIWCPLKLECLIENYNIV